MSKITRFIENVPIFEDYVYYQDWEKEFDGDEDDFYDWCEEHGLTGQTC